MSIVLSNIFAITTIGLTGSARHLPPIDSNKEYEGAKFALELDGVVVGWVANLQGGEIGTDVVEEKLGADVVARKHLGNVKYEDISFRSGLELSTKFYDWIKASLAGDFTQHNGAIITTDAVYKPIRRLEFTKGLISEICIPAADAASKDSGWFTFRISPESTKPVTVQNAQPLQAPPARKSWTASNFRITINNIDCTKVSRIGGLIIKEKVVELGTGAMRDPEGVIVNPLLNVTVPPSNRAAWDSWYMDFVQPGHNTQAHEKIGQIDFLAADLKTAMCSLSLKNVGIYKITDEKGADGKVKNAKVEMFFEHGTLSM